MSGKSVRLEEVDEELRGQLEGPRRPVSKKQMSVVAWDEERGEGRVVTARGNYLQTMGRSVQGSVYLTGEEMAFLHERGVLSMSPGLGEEGDGPTRYTPYRYIQGVGIPLEVYHIYAYLKTLGYVAFRYGQAPSERTLPEDGGEVGVIRTRWIHHLGWVAQWIVSWMFRPASVMLGLAGLRTREGWGRKLGVIKHIPMTPIMEGKGPATLNVWRPKGMFSKRRPGPPSLRVGACSSTVDVRGLLQPGKEPIPMVLAVAEEGGPIFTRVDPVPTPMEALPHAIPKRRGPLAM